MKTKKLGVLLVLTQYMDAYDVKKDRIGLVANDFIPKSTVVLWAEPLSMVLFNTDAKQNLIKKQKDKTRGDLLEEILLYWGLEISYVLSIIEKKLEKVEERSDQEKKNWNM